MTDRNVTDSAATIRVWDPLVRMFHWGLVASFAIAFLSEDSATIHETAGYVVIGLVAFRLVWGLLGSKHARFTDFVRSPATVVAYIGDVVRGHPARFLGHNPAGGAMVVALLLAVAATACSGWLMTTDRFWGFDPLEEFHELAANGTVLLVVLHVGGVILSSLQHRENLVRAMVTGQKPTDIG